MPHQIDVAIVADDLTGALDAAAPFAEVGLATRVFLDTELARSDAPPGVLVLSLTTESRHLSSQAAAEHVFNATRAMLVHAPHLLLKKIDSTLRGNVTAEILSCLRATERRHTLIAPAVPRQGRTTRAGEVLVRGVPLRREIGAEALSPSSAAPFLQVLRSVTPDISVHVWSSGAEFSLSKDSGIHAYVVDCESEADLSAIAKFVLAYRDSLLPVGASGLATAIAQQMAQNSSLHALPENVDPPRQTKKPVLFVVGSRTAESAAQTAQLLAIGAKELILPLRDPRAAIMRFDRDVGSETQPIAWILRPQQAIKPSVTVSEVARLLGCTAAELVRRQRISELVIAGGDTAFETFRALGIQSVSVLGEIMPGIVKGKASINGGSISFITKAGGFGDADAFVEILQSLN